jgi:hypothetical protein
MGLATRPGDPPLPYFRHRSGERHAARHDRRIPDAHRRHAAVAAQPLLGYGPSSGLTLVLVVLIVLVLLGRI